LKNEKIAITGHTKGIGARLYQHLSPNSIGFSKSTGYDITNPMDRARIVQESKDCDIFINNARSEFSQTSMLLDMYRIWYNDTSKTIINVGSIVAEKKIVPSARHDLLDYQAQKYSLKQTSQQLSEISKCKIIYKWFGYVGTEKILAKYPNFTPDQYITEDQAVDIILS
jgi:hypothetical protein